MVGGRDRGGTSPSLLRGGSEELEKKETVASNWGEKMAEEKRGGAASTDEGSPKRLGRRFRGVGTSDTKETWVSLPSGAGVPG